MKNNRINNNNFEREIFSSNELLQARRAHEAMRKQRAKRRNSIIATGCCVLAAVASFVVLGVTMINQKSAGNAPAAKTSVAAQPEAANNAAKAEKDSIFLKAANQDAAKQEAVKQEATKQEAPKQEATKQEAAPGKHHSGAVWNGKGNPLHVAATGKTSYGYDWTYQGGGGLVELGCDYTFANNHYDFSIIGKAPGTSSMTIYYHTDNNTKVPVTVNFKVDSDLNVTAI